MCGLLGGFRAAREGVCLCRFVTDQDGVAKPRSSSVLGVTAVAMRTRRGGSHGIRAPTFYFHGVPVISQNPPELWGLYSRRCPSRMKCPQRFPCFCSVPGFRASTAVPTFPRRSPWCCSVPGFRASTQLCTFQGVFLVRLQCPRIPGLYSGSNFSTALLRVSQCPQIPGLYSGSHFPGRFPVRLQCPRVQGLYTAFHFITKRGPSAPLHRPIPQGARRARPQELRASVRDACRGVGHPNRPSPMHRGLPGAVSFLPPGVPTTGGQAAGPRLREPRSLH